VNTRLLNGKNGEGHVFPHPRRVGRTHPDPSLSLAIILCPTPAFLNEPLGPADAAGPRAVVYDVPGPGLLEAEGGWGLPLAGCQPTLAPDPSSGFFFGHVGLYPPRGGGRMQLPGSHAVFFLPTDSLFWPLGARPRGSSRNAPFPVLGALALSWSLAGVLVVPFKFPPVIGSHTKTGHRSLSLLFISEPLLDTPQQFISN